MSKYLSKTIIAILLISLVVGSFYYYKNHKPPPIEQRYRLQEIVQGDITQTVAANGTLNPVTLISVGAQVSGRVSKLYVDFNDHVEKGQMLLTLDDALFTSQIEQSEGNVRNMQASLELASANETRMRNLYLQEYVSKQELDQSVQSLKSAQAQLDTAKAQLSRDKINQSYSVIRSPVSGVVVDRVVDIGQTVAASFQTPTLIKIAQDLSKMQIDSSFAEADIGNIKVGQKAKFSVDAFPNRSFEGIVKQLRLNPTVTSNVVTYDVVVSVDNPEQILLPGMTAYVNIMVEKHENVKLVPNACLRFKPPIDQDQIAKSNQTLSKKKTDKETIPNSKLYIVKFGKLTPIPVTIGISDGRNTEIITENLKVNDQVIVGEVQSNADSPSPSGTNNMRFRMF